jgi:hypothetical protein
MTTSSNIKFINYELHEEVKVYECAAEISSSPEPVNRQMEQKQKPNLLINVYDPKSPNTNYTNTIHMPRLKDALFIYLSNNENSGYAGGSGGGTAAIGNKENTFGIITGHYDSSSSIPTGGFQNLQDAHTFKLCHRLDNKTYTMSPKQAIDYLLGQLSELIQNKKYKYIILPCELIDKQAVISDYKSYTIGAKIFNTAPEVKNYIYNAVVDMTTAKDEGMQLITDFLK